MKTAITTAYIFTPSSRFLDLSSISGFDIRLLYAVINATAGVVIYAQGSNTLGFTSVNNGVLSLIFNTNSMNSTDELMIIYEEAYLGSTLTVQQQQITQETASAVALGTPNDVSWDGITANASVVALLKLIATNAKLTVSSLTTVILTLPVTEPSTPGLLWINNGILTLTLPIPLSMTLKTPTGTINPNAALTFTGTFAGIPPTSIDYNLSLEGWQAASATINQVSNTFSFSITAPATAGNFTMQVRNDNAQSITASCNFTVTAIVVNSLTITAPSGTTNPSVSTSFLGTYLGTAPTLIDYNLNSEGWLAANASINTTAKTYTFTITSPPTPASYSVEVRSDTTQSETATCNLVVTAPSPVIPTIIATSADSSVVLGISAMVPTGGIAIASYNIFMGTTSSNETLLANTTSSTYFASGLTNGTTYYFYAESVGQNSVISAKSNVASAIPISPPVVNTAFAAGFNLSGLETGDSVVPGTAGVNYFVPQQSDLVYFANKGLKSVRLPILWGRIQQTLLGALDPTYLGYITSTIAAGHALGMTFIVDIHNYATYNNAGTSATALTLGGPAKNGQGPLTAAHFVDLWTKLATALKGTPGLAGYDLQNEPHDLQDSTGAILPISQQDTLWTATVQSMINAIGPIDSTTPLYIEALNYSDAYYFWTNSPSFVNLISPHGNQLIMEAHTYLDRNSSGSYFDWATEVAAGDQLTNPVSVLDVDIGVKRTATFLAGCKSAGFPSIIGETGVGNDDPNWNIALENMLQYCQTAETPCFYWCGGQGYANYPLGIEPTGTVDTRQMAVLCYFSGTTDSPTTYILSGPSRGTPSAVSTAFTVDVRGIINTAFTITLNDGGAGGTFSPAVISVTTGFNFLNNTITYTAPSTAATIVISGTNTGGLQNAPSIGYSTIADLFSTISTAPSNVLWPTLIDTTYIGPAIQLYRVSDAAIKTFNFVGGVVDHASITTWAGSSAVTVVTAYDQGPHSQNAVPIFSDNQAGPVSNGTGTQLNTNVNQYPAYVLNAYNGKPALRFAGSKMDANSTIAGLAQLTVLIAANPVTIGDSYCMLSWSFVQNVMFCNSSGQFLMSNETNSTSNVELTPGTMNIYAYVFDGTGGTITTFFNGTQIQQQSASETTIEFEYRSNFNIGWYRFYPSDTNFDLGGYVVFPTALTNSEISAFSTKMTSDLGISFPSPAIGLELNGSITSTTIPVKLPVVPAGTTSIVWQYRTTGSNSWNTALTENETAGATNITYSFSNLTSKTNYDLQVVPYEGVYAGVSSQLLSQKTLAQASGSGSKIAHLGFNISGLDLNFSFTQNQADITRFAGYGFNVYRIPFTWELMFPVLPNAGGTISTSYLASMMQYVNLCTSLQVTCLLDMHSYGQYNLNGTNILINTGGNAGDPVTQDLVTSWLAIATASGIKNNQYVRIGIMNEPHLSDAAWSPISTAVVAALRDAGVTNIVHQTGDGSQSLYPQSQTNYADPQANGTIWEIHLYTDSGSAGTGPIPASNEYAYAQDAQRIAGAWRQMTNPWKLFWGEVGFDSGASAQIALPLFLQIVQQNADVFDGITYWSAGQEFGTSYIYNMNSVNGVECPTTLESMNYLPGGTNYGYDIPTVVPNTNILNGSVATYTAAGTGPFPHSTVQNGSVGEETLIFCSISSIPPNSTTSLTIEWWFNSTAINGSPAIIGGNGTFYVFGSATTTAFWFGNNSTRIEIDVTTTQYFDGNWHHVEANAGPAGIFIFYDGVLKASNPSSFVATGPTTNYPIGIRGNGKNGQTGTPYTAALSCVAMWTTQKHTANFTRPTDYYTGLEHGLLGYWPLNGDSNAYA